MADITRGACSTSLYSTYFLTLMFGVAVVKGGEGAKGPIDLSRLPPHRPLAAMSSLAPLLVFALRSGKTSVVISGSPTINYC